MRAAAGAVVVALAGAAVACGQVTGLSDDYTYDLGSADAGADGAKVEAGGDAAAGADSAGDTGPRCGAAQIAAATSTLSSLNGTSACKQCLAASCCTEVEACAGTGVTTNCKNALQCDLDCTQESAQKRAECFNNCANKGTQAFQPLDRCAMQNCTTPCGFP